VLVGENFRFGRGRAGDLARLEKLGTTLGFEARAVQLGGDASGAFSSSRIRSAIAEGDLDVAESLLGRPHALTGIVVRGDQRGRTIGVPTANLEGVVEVLPPNGVYACLVDRLDAGGTARRLARGVANVGNRPTVDAGFSVEAHLFDFDDDLYDARLRVHLVARLREERRLSGLDALKAQIQTDIGDAERAAGDRSPEPDAGDAWY
jgi:riboflavin kinase/FMN adenylyltransferase